jgi:hypothetical protein
LKNNNIIIQHPNCWTWWKCTLQQYFWILIAIARMICSSDWI